MNRKLIVLLYAVALKEFCSHITEGIISSCKGVAVNKGEGTNITCHFGEDISKIQKDVKLYHEEDSVLIIAWNDGFPDIHTKSGYQFDGRITTNITVKIPHAQTEHAGKYTCQVVLSKAFEATPCTLVISNPCAVDLNITEREHTITGCKHESNVDQSSDKIYKAAIGVLAVSLALSVCANIYFIYQKKRMRQTDRTDDPSNVQSKLLPTKEENNISEELPETPPDLSETVVQTVNNDDNQSSSNKKNHNRNDSACYSMDGLL